MGGMCPYLVIFQVFFFPTHHVFFSNLQVWFSDVISLFWLFPSYKIGYPRVIVPNPWKLIGLVLNLIKVCDSVLEWHSFGCHFFLISLNLFLCFYDIVLSRSRFFLPFFLLHNLIDISFLTGICYFVFTFFRPLLLSRILAWPWYNFMNFLLIFKVVTSLGEIPSIFLTFFNIGHLPIFHLLGTIEILFIDGVLNSCLIVFMVD